jgi:NADH-quinone oxidoreductase subunit M
MNDWTLTILTFLPLVGVVTILLLKPFGGETDNKVRGVAVVTAVITFLYSLVVLAQYNPAIAGLQLQHKGDWIPSIGVSYYMGVDGISILMVLLTTFIAMLGIASSWSSITTQVRNYYIFMLLLEVGMLGVFLAQDLFLFYVFWEVTLVPMYFLIGIWGGKERVYAALKFFLYTMAGSLLMLLAILYMGITNGTFSLPALIEGRALFAGAQHWLFLGFAIAFAIKVPVFPFHSWLPDAHTQAPTAGSIVLAGVLLKMGTYGFMRFNLPLFPEASVYYAPSSPPSPSSASSTEPSSPTPSMMPRNWSPTPPSAIWVSSC